MTRAMIDRNSSRKITKELRNKKSSVSKKSSWAERFTTKEVQVALKNIKFNKVSGLDEIYPEFLKHSGPKTIR